MEAHLDGPELGISEHEHFTEFGEEALISLVVTAIVDMTLALFFFPTQNQPIPFTVKAKVGLVLPPQGVRCKK